MLRNKNLIPLSRQHQHGLALCVRLTRALQEGAVNVQAWQEEIQQIFEHEVSVHFAAEEKEIFPRAARFPELQPLVEELKFEHGELRNLFSQAKAGTLDLQRLIEFGEKFPAHIRQEERQLFEALQQKLTAKEMNEMGIALEPILAAVTQVCSLPVGDTTPER